MNQALFYNGAPCNLRQLAHATCPNGIEASDYERTLADANSHISTATLATNKPLLLPGDQTSKITNLHHIENCSRQEHEVLSSLSSSTNGAAVMGLASFLWDTKLPEQTGDLVTFGGNGMGASTAAASAILTAIDRYDRALQEFEQLKNHRAAPRTLRAAEIRAKHAFDAMNTKLNRQAFGYLNNINYKMRTSTNLTGREVNQSIPIRDNNDVRKLAKLAKAGRVLGPGVILLDGYLRAKHVKQLRARNNPNWKRERFVQTGAFLGGIAAGVAIGLFLAPTGIVVALFAGGLIGLTADKISQDGLRQLYERTVRD